MDYATLLLISVGTIVLATVLLIVYAIRCVVRVIALYAAAWAVQADRNRASRENIVALAQDMTNFVFRGRRKGRAR